MPSCQPIFQKDDASGGFEPLHCPFRNFPLPYIVVLLASSEKPVFKVKRGRLPRMPLNKNWRRFETHWNRKSLTNTRKVSLKLSRHLDDILACFEGSACIPVAFALLSSVSDSNMLKPLLTSAHLYDDGAKLH